MREGRVVRIFHVLRIRCYGLVIELEAEERSDGAKIVTFFSPSIVVKF